MKKMLMGAVLLAWAQAPKAQTKMGDTTVVFYNHKDAQVEKGQHIRVGVSWPEQGKWREQRVTAGDYVLLSEGWYADRELKIKDGVFLEYGFNGMVIDSCFYRQNKPHGTQKSWYSSGELGSVVHWSDGLPVDTAAWFQPSGRLQAIQLTDSNGSGLYRSFADSGNLVRISGRLYNGQKHGPWVYTDADGIKSFEAVYDADTVATATCYDAAGQPEQKGKDCVLEKPAGYPGGLEAWRVFLERNLNYPPDAMKANAEGTVRVEFIIEKDGRANGFKVLASPHPSLSAEALRIMKRARLWEPAVQYNRKVVYRHIQSITFALQ
jgi:TonB family protein